MDSVERQHNLPPQELGDSTFILKPIELDWNRFPDCTISNDKDFFQQLHRSTLAKGSRLLSDDQCRDLIFYTSDTIIISVVELLYTGTASISVGNRAEFIRVIDILEIDIQSQQQQQQFVATTSSAQTFNLVPKVTDERNATDEEAATKPIVKRKAGRMSRKAVKIMPRKKEKLSAEEHLKETEKFGLQPAESNTQAEPRNQMSQDEDEENDSRPIPIALPGKECLKPLNRQKDGPTCPTCRAVFKTLELVTLHYNRAHIEKRVRHKTAKLAQMLPTDSRTRYASKAQNRPSLDRQSSATETANTGTSLKGPTAQVKPDEDKQGVREVSPYVF